MALLPDKPTNRNTENRLNRFQNWLREQGRAWYQITPDTMTAYKDYLLERLKLTPHNAKLHLAAVCNRYEALLKDPPMFTRLVAASLKVSQPSSAFINRMTADITDAIQPDVVKINYIVPKKSARYLTREQVEQLLTQPNRQTLSGLRDFAILCLLAGTGINDFELLALQTGDINSEENGQPALHVPAAASCTERLIPYGSLTWAQQAVQLWMKRAGIKNGPVFLSLRKNEKLRDTAMTVQALYRLLKQYPIQMDGRPAPITVMDLRRTYARHLYEHGMRLEAIQLLMGHSSVNTTKEYVGKAAKPPLLFEGIPIIYSVNVPEG